MPGFARQGRQGGRKYTQHRGDTTSAPNGRASRPPKKNKNAKRALNAFAIAQHTASEDVKPRSSRLGEIENDASYGKRRRDDEDEEESENEDEDTGAGRSSKKLKRGEKDRHGNEIDGGSDSEGNEWITGAVDSDDDSSLDSDEAMGESDEERFEGFKFGGSTSSRHKKRKIERREELTLEEDDERELSSGEESEGFAADAIDLADVLDQSSDGEDDEEEEDSASEGSDEEEEDLAMSDIDEDANDPRKLSALQDLLFSMDPGNTKQQRSQLDLAQEAVTPSEYGLNPRQKLSVADLLATVTNPTLRKSLKILADDGKRSKTSGVPGKLSVPLPKRQQDRIDRAAAFEKSKETLNRWIETVKHNRRAEHLVFPLIDQDVEAAKTAKRLLPNSKPANDLEATIQQILADSGLGESGKKPDEEIQKFEELATNQLPIEEVRARQAELRRARELLFREEIRAKRIKKIKSKSYRRVHRKERERNALRDQEAMAAAGFVPSEDEQERMDRRRAEERMGQRHRESRWAKSVKETGRAAWDDDARDGVAAMLRQDEELKRRIYGKAEEGSESESESEVSEEDEEAFANRMHDKLSKLSTNGSQPESKLSSMKFMQKAEAARRAQNDEAMEQLQRELDGVSEDEDSESGGAGRRKFGPASKITTAIQPKEIRQDFEEGHASDQEAKEAEDVEIIVNGPRTNGDGNSAKKVSRALSSAPKTGSSSKNRPQDDDGDNPFTAGSAVGKEINPFGDEKKKSRKKNTAQPNVEMSSKPTLLAAASNTTSKPKSTAAPRLITEVGAESDAEESDAEFGGFSPPPTSILQNKEALFAQAFAGDEDFTEKNFSAEKAALASEEAPEDIVTGGLPGWGSWVGPGLTKREKRDAKSSRAANTKISKSSEGVLSTQRKDRNLDKVIISEKRVPKTAKYLASSLPHPFESKMQYERSLRLPMGPEFTTKTTFQGMTKPRVIVKGGIVAPMRKPLM